MPLAGSGCRTGAARGTTDAGKQLWWDWRLDDRLLSRLGRAGGRGRGGGQADARLHQPLPLPAAGARHAVPRGAGSRGIWC